MFLIMIIQSIYLGLKQKTNSKQFDTHKKAFYSSGFIRRRKTNKPRLPILWDPQTIVVKNQKQVLVLDIFQNHMHNIIINEKQNTRYIN